MSHKRTAVVVGGGLAGLASAAYLARDGWRVRLFERAGELGGRARTDDDRGYLFNQGPHALYRRAVGMEVLRELGVRVSGRVPRASGNGAIRRGRLERLPVGPASMLATRLFGAAAKLSVTKLLLGFGRVDADKLRGVPIESWIDERLADATARELLHAIVRLTSYVNAPDELDAGCAVRQVQLAVKGNVLYLDGGWRTLVEALAARARDAGAELSTDVRVEAVELDDAGGRVAAVRLADGTAQAADAVVLALAPRGASGLCGEREPLAAWATSSQPVRAACLDVALSTLPRSDRRFALGVDRPHYASVHSAYARLAPAGAATVHAMRYLAPSQQRGDERELEELLELLQPGWSRWVVKRRFLPAMVVAHRLPSAAQGGLAGRPGPLVPGVRQLAVAGDWVGPEGWLADGSLASGRRAARVLGSS